MFQPPHCPARHGRRLGTVKAFDSTGAGSPDPAHRAGRASRHPSPTWRAFLAAHRHDIAAIDFFVVPTLTFRLLFGFVVLRHDRRDLLHIGVTDQPTSAGAAQQIVHAFPDETGPAYLLRDRDAIYGADFQRRIERPGICQVVIAPRAPWQKNSFATAQRAWIEEVLTAPHSPWQNPFAERLTGSIRRELSPPRSRPGRTTPAQNLDSLLHQARTHLALDKDAPRRRADDALARPLSAL